MPVIGDYVSGNIADSRGISKMDVLRLFLSSETHEMLTDYELKMRHFSPCVLFDLWEHEAATGDPRNSLYLRGMKLDKEFEFFAYLLESYANYKNTTAHDVLQILDEKN